jgi:prepilin-type N-terminal cleavage/methylation domain-containing protein
MKSKITHILSNSQKGFTLAELLAVMMVFAVVGSIIGAILVTSLRTSTKAGVITTVKQNGTFALTQMSKILRDARILKEPYPCGLPSDPTATSSVLVVTNDGLPIRLECVNDVNGDPINIASNGAYLLDTAEVSLATCSFTCSQNSISDYPIIGINFSLNATGSGNFAENTASASAIGFSSSITLRNLDR